MTPKKQTENVKYPAMLDTLLKNFVAMAIEETPDGTSPSAPPLNWEALSQAVPDTNPEMCRERFQQLRNLYLVEQERGEYNPTQNDSSRTENGSTNDPLYDYVQLLFQKDEKERKRIEKAKRRADRVEKQKRESDDATNTDSDTRSTTPSSFPPSSTLHNAKLQGGPSMVIHVCDEAKNLKQDFTCPRDLLIQEMRYFAEYLSVDSQRLEEVDISVHCDIHIFDWLMRYVKRNSGLVDPSDVPKLEPSNVVSILISSDFLKMDSLVEECISYCQKNLSQIVSTPCNMNCVNEKLTDRIAARFTHVELEEVKDRKDKFKSKLFCRKIEKLFDRTAENPDCPGDASTLFRCKFCGRVLTRALRGKTPCTNSRMYIDSRGLLSFKHEPDLQWDVSTFILSIHEEVKKWGLVYWKLWGIVNQLDCSRCGQSFQLCEFGRCQYHPERPQFRQLLDMQVTDNAVGLYPCCNARVLRFDPTGLSKGCRLRDHVVNPSNKIEQKLLDEAAAYKHLIQSSTPQSQISGDLNMFSAEESSCGVLEPTSTPAEILSSAPPPPKPSPVSVKVQRTVSPSDQYYTGLADNSEEDTGEEEPSPKIKYKPTSTSSHMSTISMRPVADKQPAPPALSIAITPSGATTGPKTLPAVSKKSKDKMPLHTDNTVFGQFPSKQRWEGQRSIRWNQDVQREDDMRRLQDISTQLTKQRIDKGDRSKAKDTREYPGGIFSKLEANFYSNLRMNNNAGGGSGRLGGGFSNRDARARGRPNQVRY